jgi:hypothetical protein
MDAMLYMTTGFIDRKDEDIMLETAICKIFCSEMGFRTADHALQIMGGDGYMTENELERLWRDSRINTIVEGANEVMHSFVFAYGSKQLGEYMLQIKRNPLGHLGSGLRLALELFLGVRRRVPSITRLDPKLDRLGLRLTRNIRDFAYQVKKMLKTHREEMITRQTLQERLSWCAIWIHATACTLARADHSIRSGTNGDALAEEMRIVEHVCEIADQEIHQAIRELYNNTDRTMLACSDAAMSRLERMPNSDYVIPEKTPDESGLGTGREPDQTHIPQFGSGSTASQADVSRP